MKRICVVYFSRKGYVRALALEEARKRDADVLEISTSEPTKGVGGFWWCGRFGMLRRLMPLLPYDTDVSAYEKILVFTPIWVFGACAPVRAFLSENKGRFRALEYTLVHFSLPMRFAKSVRDMDALSGHACERYASVCVMWGKRVKTRIFENL